MKVSLSDRLYVIKPTEPVKSWGLTRIHRKFIWLTVIVTWQTAELRQVARGHGESPGMVHHVRSQIEIPLRVQTDRSSWHFAETLDFHHLKLPANLCFAQQFKHTIQLHGEISVWRLMQNARSVACRLTLRNSLLRSALIRQLLAWMC